MSLLKTKLKLKTKLVILQTFFNDEGYRTCSKTCLRFERKDCANALLFITSQGLEIGVEHILELYVDCLNFIFNLILIFFCKNNFGTLVFDT